MDARANTSSRAAGRKHTKVEAANLPLPMWHLVGLMAALMSLSALAIDINLPAFDDIAGSYGVTGNAQQWILFSFMVGYGFPQLIIGPLSDSLGRRGLLLFCLAGYVICGFACMFAPSFAALLALRAVHGVFSGGVRVLVTSIVRDVVEGRAMARIMSLVMTLFMAVPILAPALGQGIIAVSNWQWTFGALGIAGVLVLVWVTFALPETLASEDRREIRPSRLAEGYAQVFRSRQTLGYMVGSGVIFGSLFAYIGASEQLYSEVFDREAQFPLWFAVGAGALMVANLTNSTLVERFGMRRISHSALFAFVTLATANLVLMGTTEENFTVFITLFVLNFACFGMIGANFSALAMTPLGKVAGTAGAVYGFSTTTLAAGLGYLVARRFDGTVNSILIGFLALGLISLLIVVITERGKLFGVTD